jgi:hypothetical protein
MAKEKYIVENFDRHNIGTFFDGLDHDVFLSLWSPIEIKLLSEISPLTVKKINDFTNSNYNVISENLEEQAKVLATFLIKSIDNSIFKGIMNPNMVKSKVRNLEKLYSALEVECPILQDDVDESNFIDFAYQTKQLALSIAKRYQKNIVETRKLEPQNTLNFVSFFEDLFGNNLERIVQYGSSVKGEGDDIDLILLLNELNPEIYDLIKGKRSDVPSDKDVGIVLLPLDGLTAYTGCNYNNLTIANEGILVYGKTLDFPVISEEEYVTKIYFKAGKELTSFRGALGDISRQEALTKSPEFLRDTLKLEIWIKKALLQKKLGKYLSKDEFLESHPVTIVDLGDSPSINDVKNVLYDANCRVKEAITNYFS